MIVHLIPLIDSRPTHLEEDPNDEPFAVHRRHYVLLPARRRHVSLGRVRVGAVG